MNAYPVSFLMIQSHFIKQNSELDYCFFFICNLQMSAEGMSSMSCNLILCEVMCTNPRMNYWIIIMLRLCSRELSHEHLLYLYSCWNACPGPGPAYHCYCSVLQTWTARQRADMICHVNTITTRSF